MRTFLILLIVIAAAPGYGFLNAEVCGGERCPEGSSGSPAEFGPVSDDGLSGMLAWRGFTRDQQLGWNRIHGTELDEWRRMKKSVEEKWGTLVQSTQFEWVDYGLNADTRCRVDFKEGKLILEATVPKGSPKAIDRARRNMGDHLKTLFRKTDDQLQGVLEELFADRHGERVGAGNLDRFLKITVGPSVRENFSVDDFDHGGRRFFKTEIAMVPEHLRIQAQRYHHLVWLNARRFDVEPHLIMAIIHTESFFNPKAISPSGACGLMQVMPDMAAREAAWFLYGEDRTMTCSRLMDPVDNVALGSAYLFLLKNNYFAKVVDNDKSRFISICGYNMGPGALGKILLKYRNLDSLNPGDAFDLLRQVKPRETSDYLAKVAERMKLYAAMFQ